jgi:hypothetical protein
VFVVLLLKKILCMKTTVFVFRNLRSARNEIIINTAARVMDEVNCFFGFEFYRRQIFVHFSHPFIFNTAFDKIYGDLYPAVAFYNIGQELQILPDGCKTTCSHESIPISPSKLSMDDISLLNELILCMYSENPLSHRLSVMIAEHCNQWCSSIYMRYRTVSKKDIFLAIESPLLKRFNLIVGERVRTFYGVAEVAGVAYNRIWFKVNAQGEVWFFTIQQIMEGRSKKLFMRCGYNITDNNSSSTLHHTGSTSSLLTAVPQLTSGPSSTKLPTENQVSSSSNALTTSAIYSVTFDSATILDLLDPLKWTKEMDFILLEFLIRQSEIHGIEPWKITSEKLFENFRTLQQQLSRVILTSNALSHRWGISGPKRKAVIARLGLIRVLNQMIDMYLPFFISDQFSHKFDSNKMTSADDFIPIIESYTNIMISPSYYQRQRVELAVGEEEEECYLEDPGYRNRNNSNNANNSSSKELKEGLAAETGQKAPSLFWSPQSFSWDTTSTKIAAIQEVCYGPLHALRHLMFRQIKLNHFQEVIKRTATRPSKTDDDYDYPENLPHVKINRLKALRAREAAELLSLSGEDLLLNTMFCQLWKELKQNNAEKLRISYTHPMDDGQSRSFKIKFEAEGVDDYGGPYREIFQQICNELQLLHPSQQSKFSQNHFHESDVSSSTTVSVVAASTAATTVAAGNNRATTVHSEVVSSLSLISSFIPKDILNRHNNATTRSSHSHHTHHGTHSHHHRPSFSHGKHSSSATTGTDLSSKLNCFLPLLLPTPNWTNDAECTEKYRFMFNPNSKSQLKKELFYFFGQLVGMAVRSKITLDLAFPSFLWKSLVGEKLTEMDLASFDQSSFNFIQQLKSIHENYQKKLSERVDSQQEILLEEEDYEMIRDLTWTATLSDHSEIELIPNGKNLPVNLSDLSEYLTLYVNARFQESKVPIQLFRSGLLAIIPESSISILTWDELQSIVCGSNTIDISRLQDNTEYDDDVASDDPHILYFWEVLNEFNEMEKSAFLKFVWARPSLPPKDVEFTQKMRILSATTDDNSTIKQDQFLPKAHTCFFSINLPKYSSKRVSSYFSFIFFLLFLFVIFLRFLPKNYAMRSSTVPKWMAITEQRKAMCPDGA